MQSKINYQPIENFVRCLQNQTYEEQPFTYFEGCQSVYDALSFSIHNNLVVLSQEEINSYTDYIESSLYAIEYNDISFNDIEPYLTEYGITYDALFTNYDNELTKILDGNPYYTKNFTFDYGNIQKAFCNFWRYLFVTKALKLVKTLEGPKVASKSQFTVIEKLIIIRLLQKGNLFPAENQTTLTTAVSELIAVITGISSEHEVRKQLSDVEQLFSGKFLRPKQKVEKNKNLVKIKPIISKLKNHSLDELLRKLENKVK